MMIPLKSLDCPIPDFVPTEIVFHPMHLGTNLLYTAFPTLISFSFLSFFSFSVVYCAHHMFTETMSSSILPLILRSTTCPLMAPTLCRWMATRSMCCMPPVQDILRAVFLSFLLSHSHSLPLTLTLSLHSHSLPLTLTHSSPSPSPSSSPLQSLSFSFLFFIFPSFYLSSFFEQSSQNRMEHKWW
jgi:hypothetical protein